MKYSKIFRTLALAVILAMLAATVPAIPTYAVTGDEDIDVYPSKGEIDDEINIDGFDFETNDGVYIFFSREEADVDDDIDTVDAYALLQTKSTNDNGDFSTDFDVPDELTDGDDDEDVRGGDYYVYVTYSRHSDIVAKDDFTVIGGDLELDPDEGPVGTEVEITGEGFADREDITVEYGGDEIDIESGDDETDNNGEFTLTIIIPESAAGDYTITVSDESGSEAEVEFTVEPEITIDPTSGSPGSEITVTGTGFDSGSKITIEFDRDEVRTTPLTVSTDSDGSFDADFFLPVIDSGTYEVEAEDEDGNKAQEDFTLAAGVDLSKTTGNVGDDIIFSGTGFRPNATVTITYAPLSTVATTTADANGAFSATFTVPASQHGQHTVTASDGTNAITATFTMESTPPPAPAPLLPEMGVKAKSEAFFDWNDVDDPSGVTYSLQIATDESFTGTSVVLEKEGLTNSEYTLTKEEKLESTKKEAPYYWRIMAVDGASNESGWTTPGEFYVGFTFAMPGWAIYFLAVLGGLVLLALGFYLGRRTAYYS